MKLDQFLRTRVGIGAFAIALLMSGCLDKENLYNPEQGKEQLPPENEYFDFQLRGDVKLSVNYNTPGFQSIIEVYDQDPMGTFEGKYGKNPDLQPIYKAFTDENGRLEATMNVPTAVKEAYMYTSRPGLPQCVKLEASANGFVYDVTQKARGISSRGVTDGLFLNDNKQAKIPYRINLWAGSIYLEPYKGLQYSICKWKKNGVLYSDYVTTKTIYNDVKILDIAQRVGDLFMNTPAADRKKFLRDPNIMNIVTTEPTTLNVSLLVERGAFNNSLGYYYYKSSQSSDASFVWSSCPKYIIFPNASIDGNTGLDCGSTVQLKFFGDDYKAEASNEFPAGYTIGWFYLRNAFTLALDGNGTPDWIVQTSYDVLRGSAWACSDELNKTGVNERRFVSVYDKKSGAIVYGFEDHNPADTALDDDYSDVLFLVSSDQKLNTDDRPVLPEEEPEKPTTDTEKVIGTLCFEDNWPGGGDYDMNDVVVEYERDIEFNTSNNATQITESFKFVQKSNAATNDNFFAYQLNDLGEIVSKSDGVEIEENTKSIVIKKSAKNCIGQTFTITRKVSGNINKDALKTKDNFNPYIIMGSYTTENRKEVHLPGYSATSAVDKTLNNTGNDAYYRDKDGNFPFAIDLTILNFSLVTETKNITSEYPKFESWATSKGTEDADWYLYKK